MGKWRMGMLVLRRAPKLTEVVVGSVFLGFSFSFIHGKEMLVSFFSRYFTVSGNHIFWSASFPIFTVPIPYSFWWGLAFFTGPSTWARRRIWASSLHAISTSAFGWGSGHPPISNKGSKDIPPLPCPLSSSPTHSLPQTEAHS